MSWLLISIARLPLICQSRFQGVLRFSRQYAWSLAASLPHSAWVTLLVGAALVDLDLVRHPFDKRFLVALAKQLKV